MARDRRRAFEDAELCVIGAKKTGAPDVDLPGWCQGSRVRRRPARFPRDLPRDDRTDEDRWRGSGQAPRRHRMGLPIVGTTAAVGSLNRVFELRVFDDDDAFVAECRRLLPTATPRSLRGERSSRQTKSTGERDECGGKWTR